MTGAYRWIQDVATLADGTIFVSLLDDHQRARLVRTDASCASVVPIALTAAPAQTVAVAGGLLVETEDAPPRLVRVDRDGAAVPVPSSIPDRPFRLVGLRDDGALLFLETDARWRLVRAGPAHAPIELATGALDVAAAFAPDGARFALFAPGGPLRIIALAAPAERPPPIEPHVLAAAWLPDGRLATLVPHGPDPLLVIEDERGRHLRERAIADASTVPTLVALGGDTIAYQRTDTRTFVALDVATGARRELVAPADGMAANLARSPRDGSLAFAWFPTGAYGIYVARPGAAPARVPGPIDAVPLWDPRADALYLLQSLPPRIGRVDLATGTLAPYVTELGAPRAMIAGAAATDDGELLVLLSEHSSDVYARSLRR